MWVPPCHNVSVQIGLWWEHRFIGLFGRLGGRDGADALPGRSALRAPEFDNLTPWPIPVCFIFGVLQSLSPFLFQASRMLRTSSTRRATSSSRACMESSVAWTDLGSMSCFVEAQPTRWCLQDFPAELRTQSRWWSMQRRLARMARGRFAVGKGSCWQAGLQGHNHHSGGH